ncbi:hypothetical protein N7478_007578 [Penicillium angulare]|uniref:uncharacterized protein n=1 Tax=Penicillium angulare TaxID=116970 RepID=UPI002540332B|nr:uncharacterized protein N7478_007578 [Penicillium angulare]KAJ5272453.1 hypothetical protein N7478_007578 [Penicillium angulare]
MRTPTGYIVNDIMRGAFPQGTRGVLWVLYERGLDAHMSTDSCFTIVKPWARDLKGRGSLEDMKTEKGAIDQW